MNDIIKELALKSKLLHGDYLPRYYGEMEDINTFAKLLIKECINIIETGDDPDFSVWKIKKDFGIE